jgi:hypothetical protein
MATGPTRTQPRGFLSRDLIIQQAFALLDEHGPGALSMRRLADHLGVAPNALYTHVRSKADLVDGLIDQVYAGIDLDPDPPRTGPTSWPPSATGSAPSSSPTPPSSPTPSSSPASAPTACGWARPSTGCCGRPGSPTRPPSASSMPC